MKNLPLFCKIKNNKSQSLSFTKSFVRLTSVLFGVIILFDSCKKDVQIYKVTNLNGNEISVFGHAGMGISFKYPIDTYESIEPVLRIGADGSEMDLQMTKDSVLVVFHAIHLEDMTPCVSGTINDKLWNEISGCHIASPFSSSINIISFNQLMDRLTASGKNIHNYIFTFDCKLYTNNTNSKTFINQYANAILKAINDFNLQNNVFIESQDTSFLHLLQTKQSGLKLFIYPTDFESGFQIATSMHLFGITTHVDHITEAQIKQAHDNGVRVTLWGISAASQNVNAILKNPDFIQTDKPIELLKLFEKYKG